MSENEDKLYLDYQTCMKRVSKDIKLPVYTVGEVINALINVIERESDGGRPVMIRNLGLVYKDSNTGKFAVLSRQDKSQLVAAM